MRTSIAYHSLASAHGPLLQAVTERIMQVAVIERLYLLGLTMSAQRTESLFNPDPNTYEAIGHCFVLALVAGEGHSPHSIQDKIENNLQHLQPVTAIVLSAVQFRSWLQEGHPFACTVYEKALLLYGGDETPMPAVPPPSEAQITQNNELLFVSSKTKVQAFFAGAELYTIRKEYKLALFMLHQAAEQALSAMIAIATGLRVQTHNLDKLLRYCVLFCSELQAVFPKEGEKEKRLFHMLQRAYIDTRYGDDYAIRYRDLEMITEKIKSLQKVFEGYRPSAMSR